MSALPYVLLAVQAFGTIQSAMQQRQAGEAEAAAAEYNARLAERKGIQEEEIARKKLKQLLGTQRALYAKAGVDLSSGSPLTVLADTAAEGEKEALNIRTGAQETADLYRFQGRQAKKTAKYQSRSTLLTGLGSTGLSAYSFYKTKQLPGSIRIR